MPQEFVTERNVLIPLPDGVELAGNIVRPAGPGPAPALLNFTPYHKDGRGGRLDVAAFNQHFAARGYAALTVDLRGLGNSGGSSPEPFAPQEGRDGHAVVEWIARQPWCNGNVGMWGVSYPGITALATAATRPPHLKAIVPIHATSDLYRGVVALGGCTTGFWMRADWGPRMVAYNLLPPLLQDDAGRWARVWAEHLAGNPPWLTAWADHPHCDDYWQARVAAMDQVACPALHIGGWRDLYADCTPRDFAANTAPKHLLMGPWKHEFPDKALEAPWAGLAAMERWFDRWLKGERNGSETEPPVTFFLQGDGGGWRSAPAWPPPGVEPRDWWLAAAGALTAGNTPPATGASSYAYDPTVGIESLVWDPWTTALDPTLPRDQSADDARSLCFTGEPLREPLTLLGSATAQLELSASALPLHVVVKLAEVAPNGRSTLITTGWADLTAHGRPGERLQIAVPLRATAYRLAPGSRLRVAIACADFPRLWPTPAPALLTLFHGASSVQLPVSQAPEQLAPAPDWGPPRPQALTSANDLGGGQQWAIRRELLTDTVSLDATRREQIRLDPQTTITTDHTYNAAVSAQRPDLARMHSITTARIERATSRTELTARTVTTAQHLAVEVAISVDGQPFWHKTWTRGLGD
ncbi:MAG: CocE/NonD family hydrolase [Thermomicrobiales bacterium]